MSKRGEQDVTEEVFVQSNECVLRSTYQWERGHQNDHKELAELGSPAQMNVHVDGLAEEYNRQYGQFCSIAPVLPSTPAHPWINNATITSRYREQMQRTISKPTYMLYLTKRFKWMDGVIDDIA